MYQALYRKYRPKDFDTMLGQDHIVSTLKNQILNGNIGHAYLFSGTRGTGKTSAAKIFSRAVNCLDPIEGNPCNKCQVCQGIIDGSIMDVVEMDAASNRGVNDIRELRDKVIYPPSNGSYKVYIIDEVHMLTKEAFNALLKTLEEPPVHLIFILATTEPERIPQTILSRCQRFDFKRIGVQDMIENMDHISRDLGLKIEAEALEIIALNADGAMRDALSLLDQCVSFSQGTISYEDAIEILGIVNKDIIFQIADDMIDSNIESVLYNIASAIEEGRNISQFIKDLIDHFRNIMVTKASREPEDVLEKSRELLDLYRSQAEKLSLPEIFQILDQLTDVDEKLKYSTNPRILLEMAIIKIMAREDLVIREAQPREKARPKPRKLPREEADKSPIEKVEKEASAEENKETQPYKEGDLGEVEEEASPADEQDISLEDIKINWKYFLEKARSEKPNIYALLIEGSPYSLENNLLVVTYEEGYEFHRNAVSNPSNKSYVEELISKELKSNLILKFLMASEVKLVNKDENKNKEELIDQVKDFFGDSKVEIKKGEEN